MDTEVVRKWLGIVSDVSNLFGLQQWLAPPILAGVAIVFGVINDAPALFFVAVVVIAIAVCTTNIVRAVIKYKRWSRISLAEDDHLVKILNCLRQIHIYIKQVSIGIAESDANQDIVPDEAEHFLANLGVSIDGILGDGILGWLLTERSTNRFVERITNIRLRNRKQVLDRTDEADIVLESSLFDALENDEEYGRLMSELHGYVSEVAGSSDKMVAEIDQNVRYSRIVFAGMLFMHRLIRCYGFPDDSYKRKERQIEPAFNRELEKVRKHIRTAVLRGV